MARPEPTDRPQLPYELLSLIVSFVPKGQKGTFGALMSVNSACYELAARRLYAELRVNRRNLAGVLAGLEGLSGACACPPLTAVPKSPPLRTGQAVVPAAPEAGCPVGIERSAATATNDKAAKESTTVEPEGKAPSRFAQDRSSKETRHPSPASDSRKRALLALTRYLTVESVPDCACWQRACPLNKALLPHVRVVKVLANVPQHTVVAFEKRGRPS